MDDTITYLLLALVLLYAWSRYEKCRNRSAFSMPNKPFEPDNNLFMSNPFDDMDYITPTFRRTDDLSVLGLNHNQAL